MQQRHHDRFARIGAFLIHNRYGVLVGWLIVIAALGTAAPRAQKVLEGAGFDVGGSQSQAVSKLLDKDFHASPLTSAVVVYRAPGQVTDPGFASEAAAVDQRLRATAGVLQLRSFFDTGEPSLASRDGRTAIAAVALSGGQSAAQDAVPRLRAAVRGAHIDAVVTGYPAVQYDTYKLSQDDLAKTELITFPVVTIFLLLFFRTAVAALVPLFLGGAAVTAATGLIGILGGQFPISVFALNIGSLVGLGLSIDFSLVMVRRFREERAAGRTVPGAVVATMVTSGRSILYSGMTLLLSMGATTLIFHDIMIVRSITLGVLLVAGVGLLGGLTLLPAILAILGRRLEWLPLYPRRRDRSVSAGLWYRLSRSVTRSPVAWLLASLAVLAVLAVPLAHIQVVGANTLAMPVNVESRRGADQVEQAFGANALNPIHIVVKSSGRDGVFTPEFLQALRHLSDTVAADERTAQVTSLSTLLGQLPDEMFFQVDRDSFPVRPNLPTAPSRATAAQFVNLDGNADTATLTLYPKAGMYEAGHLGLVTELRDRVIPRQSDLDRYSVQVGGDAASFIDFRDALYGRFPLVAIVITAAILLLLIVFFRSLLLPLKAAVTSALPLVSTCGVLVWVFQDGHGARLLGFTSQGRVNVVTPLVVFVILFALSTDYEVFLLSRVRENIQARSDTERAVALGLQQTAGLITAAALILIATFGSLASSSVETLKEIGIGLAIGILLDATVVRLLIVPATMLLARGANWWLPGWLDRLLPSVDHGASTPPPQRTARYAAEEATDQEATA